MVTRSTNNFLLSIVIKKQQRDAKKKKQLSFCFIYDVYEPNNNKKKDLNLG